MKLIKYINIGNKLILCNQNINIKWGNNFIFLIFFKENKMITMKKKININLNEVSLFYFLIEHKKIKIHIFIFLIFYFFLLHFFKDILKYIWVKYNVHKHN